MMAVGKTTIGSLLSKKLGISFEDLDSTIESRESLSIKKIFDLKGEKYFRKIEEVEGLNIIKGDRKIIALGGGSFINQKIRNEIEKSSFSVWLDVAPEEIFNRIKKNQRRV